MPVDPRSERSARRPRFFSTELSGKERRVYGAVTLVFIGVFLATMWPIYLLFDRVRPFILGIPLSLFYLIMLVFVISGLSRCVRRPDRDLMHLEETRNALRLAVDPPEPYVD